eukprot:10620-Eustigmatos_ZCMA.PRE.1
MISLSFILFSGVSSAWRLNVCTMRPIPLPYNAPPAMARLRSSTSRTSNSHGGFLHYVMQEDQHCCTARTHLSL